MTDPTKRLLETLAAITAILFVISTPVALTLYSLERSIFDADLYIQAMDEENLYEQIPVVAAQALSIAAQRPEDAGILSIFRNLSREEWEGLVVQLLPAEVLRTLTTDAVVQVMGYLNGESPEAILPLGSLKAHLQSPEGTNAVYAMLEMQPDCSVEQLSAMALGQEALTLCNPPDTFLFLDLRPIVAGQINRLMSLVPEQVTLISSASARPQYVQTLTDLRVLMRISPLFPILCLFIIVVLVVRTFRDWLTWWGLPLFAAGLASMFLSVLSAPVSALTFQFLFVPALPVAFPADLLAMFRDLTAAIVRNALEPVLVIAGVVMLVGLVMVVLAFFLRKFQRPRASYR